MIKTLTRKTLTLLCLSTMVVTLAACGESLIEEAKKVPVQMMGQSLNISYGDMIAKIPNTTPTWSEVKDDKTGPMAIATIPIKVNADLPKQWEEKLKASKEELIAKAKKDIDEFVAGRIQIAQGNVEKIADVPMPDFGLGDDVSPTVHRRVIAELEKRNLAASQFAQNSLEAVYKFNETQFKEQSARLEQYLATTRDKGEVRERNAGYLQKGIDEAKAKMDQIKETMEVAPKLMAQFTKEEKEQEAADRAASIEKAKTDPVPDYLLDAVRHAEEFDTTLGQWAYVDKAALNFTFTKSKEGKVDVNSIYVEVKWKDGTTYQDQYPVQIAGGGIYNELQQGKLNLDVFANDPGKLQFMYDKAHGKSIF